MQVTSLEQMEKIVSRNRYLRWDGWTVVNSYPSLNGWSKTNGAFSNGKWYQENRYEPNENGWDIPNKLVR